MNILFLQVYYLISQMKTGNCFIFTLFDFVSSLQIIHTVILWHYYDYINDSFCFADLPC